MFKTYTGNEQFDFQINRFTQEFEIDEKVQEDLKQIVPQIKDMDSWYKQWSRFAAMREDEGDFKIASNYYKAADFYLPSADPNKQKMYEKFRENFYKGYNGFEYERYEVPYEGTFLPAIKLLNPGAQKTLVVFGGYDGYMEEIISMLQYLKGIDYNIIVFDGPGQGTAMKNGLKFIMNWEKPVSVILDYFDLKHVSLMGISWGGYLVMRAAAYEKRVEKVIAFDIYYSALDALTIRLPKLKAKILMKLIRNGNEKRINQILEIAARKSIDLNWKIMQARELTGESTPFDLIMNLKRHTMKGLGPLINQDVLLLAGENDQYVPISRLPQIQRELCNAASVTSKIFTQESGGAEHCQVGRLNLAFDAITEFLNVVK